MKESEQQRENGINTMRLSYEHPTDSTRSIQADIAVGFGMNMTSLRIGDTELIHTDFDALKNPEWNKRKFTGGYVMWPFPNRSAVDGAIAYKNGDQTISLKGRDNHPDVPLLAHGLVYDRPFELSGLESRSKEVALTASTLITRDDEIYQYFPHESKLSLTYVLGARGIKIRYSAENYGITPMPSGFGLHPLFALVDGREGTQVCIPADTVLEKDVDGLPTGRQIDVAGAPDHDLREPRPVGELGVDDTWMNMQQGRRAYVEHTQSGIRIEMQPRKKDFPYVVAFTPPPEVGDYVCLEPQSVPPNAFGDRQTGLPNASAALIPPGEARGGEVSFLVSRI